MAANAGVSHRQRQTLSRGGKFYFSGFCRCAALSCAISSAYANNSSRSAEDLAKLSLAELANIEITSVSKSAEPLSEAPAAIYVITHSEIVRSGASSIAEILRLAPNLQVARITANGYAISARGFNGSVADKLLVLIDGRTIYAPFFSGVFWDQQDVPVEDIERIEVISGPGAALWGANAVNGVINIISRRAADTQGGLLQAGWGNRERRGVAQYGGRLGETGAYRAYVDGFSYRPSETATGANARDGWHKQQGGFRADWAQAGDRFTVQGDVFKGALDELLKADQNIAGHNLLARWNREFDAGSALQVQLYYDYFEREIKNNAADYLHTYDIDIQHIFNWGARQQIVWGGGYRIMRDRFPIAPAGATVQRFDPERRTLTLGNAFAQDSIALTPALKLILGLKVEADPYSTVEALPSARLSWKASERDLWWGAISRAIRAPSRLDEDFVQIDSGVEVLKGGDFDAERLTAYEFGYRAQPSSRSSLSVSLFYNVYDDLRSFEISPNSVNAPYPLTFQNRMDGDTYGVETWGSYRVNDWWLLAVGYNWLHKSLSFERGSSGVGGTGIAGNDPTYQFSLRSSFDLADAWTLNLDLRKIAALPEPASASYTELNARLGWAVSDALEIALVGANLLHPRHLEFGSEAASLQLGAIGVESQRSIYVDTRWRF